MRVVLASKVSLDKGTGVAQYWARMLRGLEQAGMEASAAPLADVARHAGARNTVVIADNHDCLGVPDGVACIAVQHGCAGEHLSRCPGWAAGREIVPKQKRAAARPRTFWVGCSEWAASYCKRHQGVMADRIIYGAVDTGAFQPSERQRRKDARVPVVLHHCADGNKGSGVVGAVAERLKGEFEFRLLHVAPADVPRAMQDADIWLCLSAAEGLPTVVQEAMAVNLVVVGTNVGVLWPPGMGDETGATVFDWRRRGDAEYVADMIRTGWANRKRASGRRWAEAWWGVPLFGQKWADCVQAAASKLRVA